MIKNAKPQLNLKYLATTDSVEKLLNAGKIGLGVLSTDFQILDANDAWCEIMEYSKEELLQHSIPDITHPDDIQKTLDFAQQRLQDGGIYYLNKRYITGKNREIWCKIKLQPVYKAKELQCFMVMLEDITETTVNELALQNAKSQLQVMADTIPAGVAYLNTELEFRFANQGYKDLIDPPHEKIIGRNISEILPANAWNLSKPHIELAFTGQETSFTNAPRPNTLKQDVLIIKVVPDFDSQQKVQGVFILITAITNFKEAEEHLEIARQKMRSSEENLREMMGATSDTLVVSDYSGQILFANSRIKDLFGYTPEEVIGKDIEILLPEILHKHHRKLRNSYQSEPTVRQLDFNLDLIGLTKSGQHKQISIGLSPTQYDNKKAILATLSDASVMRQALRSSRELEVIIEASGDAVFRSGLDGTVQYWNKGAEQLYGYKAEDIIGKLVDVLVQGGMSDRLGVRDTLLKDEPIINNDAIRIHQDGHLLNVSIAIFPIKNEIGDIIATASVHRSIGELKHLEEQLRHAQRMETAGLIAGGIAHDFNNILTIIQGSCSLIELSLPDNLPEAALNNLGAINRAAQRASGLTRQLLSFSRKQRIETRLIDPKDLISELVLILQSTLGEDIHLDTQLLSSWNIFEDPAQLEQIILNLVMNAKQAMPDGGKITIETTDVEIFKDTTNSRPEQATFSPKKIQQGNYVQLAISDNGIGINQDILNHIFEPFYTTKPKDIGTGLGLSVVYGIVTQNGGSIHVETSNGNGTCFLVLMPKAQGEIEVQAPSQLPTKKGFEHILLVEDDLDVLYLTKAILESAGYSVSAESDPAIALETSFDKPIDLILSDIVMPGMNGVEFSKLWLEKNPDDRFLFMSGYADESVLPLSFPPENLLQKPFKIEDLLDRVNLALQKQA